MKVLIVDDSSIMRKIVVRAMRQAGFDGHEISEAANGQEALDSIHASQPDVVLCDWNMPVMSGIELLRALNAEGNSLTFGFVTSEGSEEMRHTANSEGAAFLLTKPFTPESMRDALTPVLG